MSPSSDWYKMYPIDWNEGTNDLTLEQEAAYLRICNAIYITGHGVNANPFVLCGLLRCNDRKAKRLLNELLETGKLFLEDGSIWNRRAVEEVSNRDRLAVERKSAAVRGGVESGKSRRKSLKEKESDEANASTKTNQIREDKKREEISSSLRSEDAHTRERDDVLSELRRVLSPEQADALIDHRKRMGKGKSLTPSSAKRLAKKLERAPDPNDAVDTMIANGWQGFEPEWLESRRQTASGGGGGRKASDLDRVQSKAREFLNGQENGWAADGSAGGDVQGFPRRDEYLDADYRVIPSKAFG